MRWCLTVPRSRRLVSSLVARLRVRPRLRSLTLVASRSLPCAAKLRTRSWLLRRATQTAWPASVLRRRRVPPRSRVPKSASSGLRLTWVRRRAASPRRSKPPPSAVRPRPSLRPRLLDLPSSLKSGPSSSPRPPRRPTPSRTTSLLTFRGRSALSRFASTRTAAWRRRSTTNAARCSSRGPLRRPRASLRCSRLGTCRLRRSVPPTTWRRTRPRSRS
mmetsp:Transcript_13954/g.43937  ORF Transcript_13954/g.43937 Transcript_13954/m.43937 type:complete len:217 (-) Transcript_13954:1308-1958(-)